VYLPNVSIYRTTDAGKTFVAIKGAPGGDDYHALWIDPSNPQRMIFGSDQGAGVSVDAGHTWSSWFNQPTAQFYHVAVDNDFPYHVYGAQQDSGSVFILSRSNDGAITFRDWHPAGAGESGYIAPDPSDSNIIYGGGTYGELFRYDRRTGQAQVIAPDAIRNFGEAHPEHRYAWTSPVVFSPQDPHTLYFGSQYVLRSANRGNSWEKISPDLTGTDPNVSQEGPLTVDNATKRGHGVVYTIAPSPVNAAQIWAGTDTGLIQLTRDNGKAWNNVTPSGLADWSKISLIDASRFDAGTAYAAVDRHRLDDIGPYIYRTRDFGKSWTRINNGIPNGAYVRAVREDPVKKGLLFAGTELGVFFSVNDGDSWQPLQNNLPPSPVHDLVIKDNDLVIATHGRAFWILDDISPLRQLTAEIQAASAHLFQPSPAMRIRATTHGDTPLPPEEPAGENPPPGAIFYYYLKSQSQSEVKLEVLDAKGQVVRSYSSKDQPFTPPTPPAFPAYWFKPENLLSPAAGMHRFIWDVRYSAPPVAQPGYSMFTVAGRDVPREPSGPQALPGSYQVRLTVDGRTYTQPFKLTIDPRIKATPQDLEKQFTLELKLVQTLQQANQAVDDIHAAAQAGKISAEDEKKLAGTRRRRGEAEPEGGPQQPAFAAVIGNLAQLIVTVDSADTAPTTQASQAAEKTLVQAQALLQQWEALRRK
ncbi:MAG: WD40/YVTN/BNR-like repeat-containing protein, partial [Candidatus Angelobacter sp.]